MSKPPILSEQKVQKSILILRGKRVIIDADLAKFYGVKTKVFNQAIKRNIERFPEDFMFQLSADEWNYLRSQFVTSRLGHGGTRYLPYAFTEHGAVQAANAVNSPVAVQAGILVVRVFIKTGELIAAHKELSAQIEKLEKKLTSGLKKHDKEIQLLFEAIHNLMNPPNPPRKKIGFRIGKEK